MELNERLGNDFMSTQHIKIPRDADYLNEPVRWSDCLDFLGRLENELQRREDFWRNSPSDPHGIASAVMVAMAETSKATRTVTDEVVARKFNDEALRRGEEAYQMSDQADTSTPRTEQLRCRAQKGQLDFGDALDGCEEIERDLQRDLTAALAQVEELQRERDNQKDLADKVMESRIEIAKERDTLRRERDEAMQWLDKSKADLDDCRAGRDAARRQVADERARLDWLEYSVVSIQLAGKPNRSIQVSATPIRDAIDAARKENA